MKLAFFRIENISIIILLWIEFLFTNADNNCKIDKVEIPVLPSRIVLTFECYSGNDYNPVIPIDNGSNQREYNELDLSPNLFSVLPVDQLCPFVNIYLLDLSFNKIDSLTNSFKQLECLVSLKKLDFSNNFIRTPLLSKDFEDYGNFSAHLESLNLNNNQIFSIETGVFFNSDRSPRFPSLSYLDLSFNQLRIIDLLWPMSLHSPAFKIKLNNNKITTLVNQLNLSYNSSFLVAVNGQKNVDLSFNLINYLDDSNLLQYGLQSPDDLRMFLHKISNFDFSNNRLKCACSKSTNLNIWFNRIHSFIDKTAALIYSLECSNMPNHTIFNINCPKFIRPSPTTNFIQTTSTQFNILKTTSTPRTSSTTTTTTTTIVKNLMKNVPLSAEVSTEKSKSAAIVDFNPLWLFGLLLLLILMLIITFVCVVGRNAQIFCFKHFSINLCYCLRLRELTENKPYDSTICYSMLDQEWVDEKFLPSFSQHVRGFKINKLGLDYSQTIDPSYMQCLDSSKRLILILTPNFRQNVWSNLGFQDILLNMCHKNPSFVILIINVNNCEQSNKIIQLNKVVEKSNFCKQLEIGLVQQLKHNCSLNRIENLNWDKSNFWNTLVYLMPLTVNNRQTLQHNTKRHIESPLSVMIDSTANCKSNDLLDHGKCHTFLSSGSNEGFIERNGFWTKSSHRMFDNSHSNSTPLNSNKTVTPFQSDTTSETFEKCPSPIGLQNYTHVSIETPIAAVTTINEQQAKKKKKKTYKQRFNRAQKINSLSFKDFKNKK